MTVYILRASASGMKIIIGAYSDLSLAQEAAQGESKTPLEWREHQGTWKAKGGSSYWGDPINWTIQDSTLDQ